MLDIVNHLRRPPNPPSSVLKRTVTRDDHSIKSVARLLLGRSCGCKTPQAEAIIGKRLLLNGKAKSVFVHAHVLRRDILFKQNRPEPEAGD